MLEADGFDGAYLLHDDERRTTVSATFWTDPTTAAASGAALQQHLDTWEQMTGRKATVETFEVADAQIPTRAGR
ncbi:MAG: hypothetical protein ABI649_05200 [Gaiellaceae bacterium]